VYCLFLLYLTEWIKVMGRIDIDLEIYEKMLQNRSVDIWTLIADSLPIFSEGERLSDFEFKEVEKWPASKIHSLLGSKNPMNEEERNFRACAEGLRKPETISEQAIVKLIFQALFIGGIDPSLTYSWRYDEPKELNDIRHLSSSLLRDFLASIIDDMREEVRHRHADNPHAKTYAEIVEEHDRLAAIEYSEKMEEEERAAEMIDYSGETYD
jgi:hypothetical protein